MSGRLIHYSKEPLTAVRSRAHDDGGCGACKTPGLWISVEGEYDWVSWCRSEGYGLNGFAHATEIILKPDANVKWLRGACDIDEFTHQFTDARRPRWDRRIDWLAVRAQWQGLIIAPYCWERRMEDHTMWYYGWDCASGVIWDADAIAEIRAIDPPDMTIKDEAA